MNITELLTALDSLYIEHFGANAISDHIKSVVKWGVRVGILTRREANVAWVWLQTHQF